LQEVTPIPRQKYPYSAKTAYRLARYAIKAYDSEPLLKADCGRRFYAFFKGESRARFRIKLADTEGFILRYRHRNGTYMVLAFRGTESFLSEPADWLTNLDTSLVTPDWLPATGDEPPKVHRGFLRAYETVREMVIAAVEDIKPDRLHATGHSLGGALATLAAMDIKTRFPGIRITMYSFGSPGVGDASFARLYTSTVRDSHRVVHEGDRVPEQMPDLLAHVGRQHTLARHPDTSYPHHDRKYYLEQLDKEAGWPEVRRAHCAGRQD
jgi:hypothetical protein